MNLNYGTILVVDDNPAILTAVRITLRNVFEHVITLSAPDAILATMQKERVDVILLDMNFSLGVNSGREGMIWMSAIHPSQASSCTRGAGDRLCRCAACRQRTEEWSIRLRY